MSLRGSRSIYKLFTNLGQVQLPFKFSTWRPSGSVSIRYYQYIPQYGPQSTYNVCPYAGDIFTIKIKFTFVRFKLRDNKNGLLTSHSGYSCTIVSLEILFLFFKQLVHLAPLYLKRTEVKKDRGRVEMKYR
jgi:hypothetical protein